MSTYDTTGEKADMIKYLNKSTYQHYRADWFVQYMTPIKKNRTHQIEYKDDESLIFLVDHES